MQKGEQGMVWLEHGTLNGQGFFDFDNQINGLKDCSGTVEHRGPGGEVILVVKVDTTAGLVLNKYFMAVLHQFFNCCRRQANSVLMIFYFLGNTYPHMLLRDYINVVYNII